MSEVPAAPVERPTWFRDPAFWVMVIGSLSSMRKAVRAELGVDETWFMRVEVLVLALGFWTLIEHRKRPRRIQPSDASNREAGWAYLVGALMGIGATLEHVSDSCSIQHVAALGASFFTTGCMVAYVVGRRRSVRARP